MIDPAHATVWTQSLMASLLASLILAPALFFWQQRDARSSSDAASSDATSASPHPAREPSADEPPFVNEDARRMRTLWPQNGDRDEHDQHDHSASATRQPA